MNRDELRQEIVFTFFEHGGEQTPRSLARHIGGDVTPGTVRGILLNLKRDGTVRQIEGYSGSTWELAEGTVRDRIASSLQGDDPADDQNASG